MLTKKLSEYSDEMLRTAKVEPPEHRIGEAAAAAPAAGRPRPPPAAPAAPATN